MSDLVEEIERRIDDLISHRDMMNDLPRGQAWKDALMSYTGKRFAISTALHTLAKKHTAPDLLAWSGDQGQEEE